MNILVTGGAGFIGSQFIRMWLARHPDDRVTNLDRLTYAGSRERLADIEGSARYTFLQADVCDASALKSAMAGCRFVAHFAAETHVDRSITDAAPFLRTNVEGTYAVLQAALECGVERLLHVSTDEVYGPVPHGAVDERAAVAPRSPYAASKAAGDLLAQAFHATHDVPTLIVRPTNVYGPWQLPEKFLPLCITSALDGLRIPVYGDGQQRRAWLSVTDLCDALDVVITRGAVGEIYNIAGGCERTNLDTVTEVLARLGAPASLIEFVQDRPGHDRRYAMDDAKLRALGWQPATDFAQGLSETIAWYRTHTAWWRPITQRLREDSYHWLNRPARPRPRQASAALR